jgi:hypothetical protein
MNYYTTYIKRVYLDINYYRLKQYNDKVVLTKKNLLSMQWRVGLSFSWDTFDIERIIENKMISSDFARKW